MLIMQQGWILLTAYLEVNRDRAQFSGLMISGLNLVILLIYSYWLKMAMAIILIIRLGEEKKAGASSSLSKARLRELFLGFLFPFCETWQGAQDWEWCFLATNCCHNHLTVFLVMPHC